MMFGAPSISPASVVSEIESFACPVLLTMGATQSAASAAPQTKSPEAEILKNTPFHSLQVQEEKYRRYAAYVHCLRRIDDAVKNLGASDTFSVCCNLNVDMPSARKDLPPSVLDDRQQSEILHRLRVAGFYAISHTGGRLGGLWSVSGRASLYHDKLLWDYPDVAYCPSKLAFRAATSDAVISAVTASAGTPPLPAPK